MSKKSMGRKPKSRSFVVEYLRAFRFYLVTGILVWVPLIVTVWLTWWLFSKLGIGQENLIKSVYAWLNQTGERFAIVGFLTEFEYKRGYGFLWALALFLTTGIIARNFVGRRFITTTERIFARIPLVSRIYRAVQQIRDVFVSRDGTVFHQVCLVEYPRKGIHAVAFITNRERGIVQEAIDGDHIAVFLPTTPNPTSGFLLYVHPSEVQVLDITVEEAMKLIISGGAYIPGHFDIEESGELTPVSGEPVAPSAK